MEYMTIFICELTLYIYLFKKNLILIKVVVNI